MNDDRSIFGDAGYSNLRFQHSSLLRTLRVWSDYASFQWQSKVVGYDAEQQSGWMKKLGLTSAYSYGLVLIFGILGLLLIYWGVTQFWRMQRLALRTEQKHLFEQVNEIFQKIVYLGNENQQDIQNIKKLLKECANALKVKK
ncbi:hypothetical protein D3C75_913320 [compost metagenome]